MPPSPLGPQRRPDFALHPGSVDDRCIGALLGLAVGDALGTTLEFLPRDTYPHLEGIVGGGVLGRRPGEWTDDTAMALALTTSLIRRQRLDERQFLDELTAWWLEGKHSCVGVCDDIGNTTRDALTRWLLNAEPHSGSTDPQTAGNGSLVRVAPVAMKYWRDRQALRDAAARQSKATHGAEEAVAACVAFADILADAIAGSPIAHVLAPRQLGLSPRVDQVTGGSWFMKERADIRSTGYVIHTLEAALWSIARSSSFEEAVLLAANLGHDADTVAAVTGQLAGAIYGVRGIPRHFADPIAWGGKIVMMACWLIGRDMSLQD